MKNTMKSGANAEATQGLIASRVLHQQGICHRCGGLMVGEFCTDLLSSTGELEFLASRCVQCGEVVDSVILQNRRRQQEAKSGKASPLSIHLVRREVAA